MNMAEEMKTAGSLSEERATHLLFQKLPAEMQKSLVVLHFSECAMDKLKTRATNYLDWLSISKPEIYKQETLGNLIEIDTVKKLSQVEEIDYARGTARVTGVKSVTDTYFVKFPLTLDPLEELKEVLSKAKRNRTFRTKALAALEADRNWSGRKQTNTYKPQRRFDRRA